MTEEQTRKELAITIVSGCIFCLMCIPVMQCGISPRFILSIISGKLLSIPACEAVLNPPFSSVITIHALKKSRIWMRLSQAPCSSLPRSLSLTISWLMFLIECSITLSCSILCVRSFTLWSSSSFSSSSRTAKSKSSAKCRHPMKSSRCSDKRNVIQKWFWRYCREKAMNDKSTNEHAGGPKLIFACSGAADVGEIADRAARNMTRDGWKK